MFDKPQLCVGVAVARRCSVCVEDDEGCLHDQAELPSYYGLADVLALPSEQENWGLVVNEAMAAGALPVVSDAVGAAPDLVEGLGHVFPVGDVGRLAHCLAAAADTVEDPETGPQLRTRVRERVNRYSLAATAEGYESAAELAVSRQVR